MKTTSAQYICHISILQHVLKTRQSWQDTSRSTNLLDDLVILNTLPVDCHYVKTATFFLAFSITAFGFVYFSTENTFKPMFFILFLVYNNNPGCIFSSHMHVGCCV